MKKLVFLLLTATLVACGTADDSDDDGSEPEAPTVTATLVEAADLENDLGTVTLVEDEEGVLAEFDVGANDVIEPGAHAIHIHENATCEPADSDDDGEPEAAGAAGGHFDPTDVGHGEDDGPHVGDSDDYNYAFGEDGSFDGDVRFPLASFDGETSILADGGTAMMIHAGTDDMETNPGGESGSRIACGVIAEVE